MRTLFFIATLIQLLFLSCTDDYNTRRVLEENGYTEISITGYDAWGCHEGDWSSTGFIAKSPSGIRVRGVVCGGLGSYTIRMK